MTTLERRLKIEYILMIIVIRSDLLAGNSNAEILPGSGNVRNRDRSLLEERNLSRDGDTPVLSIRCFGEFEALLDGQPLVGLQRRNGKKLLAYLMLRHDRKIPSSELAE